MLFLLKQIVKFRSNLESVEGKLTDLKRISRDLDEKNEEVDKRIEQDSVKVFSF